MYARMDADKVRALRVRRGMCWRDLADAVGISEATARSVEREEAHVQKSTAKKVARVFGLEARNIARPASQPYLRLVR